MSFRPRRSVVMGRWSDRRIPSFGRPMTPQPRFVTDIKNYKTMEKIRDFKTTMINLGSFKMLKTNELPMSGVITFLNTHYMDHEMVRNGSIWTLKTDNVLRRRITGTRRLWTQSTDARRSVFSSNINR